MNASGTAIGAVLWPVPFPKCVSPTIQCMNSPCTHLSTKLRIHSHVYLSIHLPVYLQAYPPTNLSTNQPTHSHIQHIQPTHLFAFSYQTSDVSLFLMFCFLLINPLIFAWYFNVYAQLSSFLNNSPFPLTITYIYIYIYIYICKRTTFRNREESTRLWAVVDFLYVNIKLNWVSLTPHLPTVKLLPPSTSQYPSTGSYSRRN